MLSKSFVIVGATIAMFFSGVAGYQNNCKGSSRSPTLASCQLALENIDEGTTYDDQAQFSVGNCYVIYGTDGSGKQSIKGSVIKKITKSILDSCKNQKGSYGTSNCEKCHVTVNYRKSVRYAI